MKRVVLIVLDSVGVGYLPDAEQFGDVGANTLGHILETVNPPLPNMASMGLGKLPNLPIACPENAIGCYGRLKEKAKGKDTTTGHWELMGVALEKPFPTFPNGFPDTFIAEFEKAIGRKTIGNYATSGTEVLNELGAEHVKTGYPIVYTSADSVFQIACNEEIIPIKELYDYCEKARALLQGDLGVGRVIARPFVTGENNTWVRTSNRRDFSLPPSGETLLDSLYAKDIFTMGIGKIEDIFCNRGLTASDHASGNKACTLSTIKAMKEHKEGLIFVNLVDFDMIYGHRRDVQGYANGLVDFDNALPEIISLMNDDDLLMITADHGCDPTFKGTDHTREYIPLLAYHKKMNGLVSIGERETYADIAATIAEGFGLSERYNANSFYDKLY